MSSPRTVRAPRGSTLRCKGWIQEAALRMLHNNLDPEVAERPDDLVVYGGTGKAARSWEAFDVIVRELEPRGPVGDVGRVPPARGARPDHVRADDRGLLDLHRLTGDRSGHLRDV